MNRFIKLVLFCLLLSSVPASAQLQDYLDAEQSRLMAADSLETEISNFISSNFANYNLPQTTIDAVKQDLVNEHDGSDDPITGAALDEVLASVKRSELRELYFAQNPGKDALFTAIAPDPDLLITCINGGFENVPALANYTFTNTTVGPNLTPPANHLASGCGQAANGTFTPPSAVNQFQANASVITPGAEPFLLNFGVTVPRVIAGSRSLKLNSTPTNQTNNELGQITTVSRPAVINGNSIDFRFLYLGIVVPGSVHRQPFFRYRVIDDVTNVILRNNCIYLNFTDCRFTQITGATPWNPSATVSYTPTWVCERINTAGLDGRAVRIEFTVSDCQFRGHFSTVYIDDICGVACPPTWGSIDVNPVNLNCPVAPFNVCGTISLPAGATLTTPLALNILNSSGGTVATVNNPTMTGNSFCFNNVNPSVFGASPAGTFTFQVTGANSSNCALLSPMSATGGTVSFNDCCIPTLVTAAPIAGLVQQQTSDWIKATNVLTGSTARGIYHAGNYVELNPGFETMSSSEFSAYVLGCTNTYVYRDPDAGLVYADDPMEKNEISLVKVDATEVVLFPNPGSKNVTVTSGSVITSIKIYSMDGKQMYYQRTNTKKEDLDVSRLANGIYLISVERKDGNTFNTKFIKN
jgi:hypothetical protein